MPDPHRFVIVVPGPFPLPSRLQQAAQANQRRNQRGRLAQPHEQPAGGLAACQQCVRMTGKRRNGGELSKAVGLSSYVCRRFRNGKRRLECLLRRGKIAARSIDRAELGFHRAPESCLQRTPRTCAEDREGVLRICDRACGLFRHLQTSADTAEDHGTAKARPRIELRKRGE
ncbi:hypothetical protein D3C72_1594670 [compost metagenome]